MRKSRETYLVDAAEHEKSRSLIWLQDEWREVKDALDSFSEGRNHCRSDHVYERYSGELNESNLKRLLGALDYMNVLPAVNADTLTRNQYDLERYSSDLLQRVGKEVQDREIKGSSNFNMDYVEDLKSRSTLPEME